MTRRKRRAAQSRTRRFRRPSTSARARRRAAAPARRPKRPAAAARRPKRPAAVARRPKRPAAAARRPKRPAAPARRPKRPVAPARRPKRRPRPLVPEQIARLRTVLGSFSTRVIAKRLSVDRRTVQRWKNQGVIPSRWRGITNLDRAIRKFESEKAKRYRYKSPKVLVQLPMQRHSYFDRNLKQRVYTGILQIDLQRASVDEIFSLLKFYRDRRPRAAEGFRFIYRTTLQRFNQVVKTDRELFGYPRLPKEMHARIEMMKRKTFSFSTTAQSFLNPAFDSDAGVLDLIHKVFEMGQIEQLIIYDPTLKPYAQS